MVLFVYYGHLENFLETINRKAINAEIAQITNGYKHPTKMIYDSDTGKIEYIVGTTKFEKSNDIMHGKIGSGHFYKPNKEQAFSDRILIDNSILTKAQLNMLEQAEKKIINEKQIAAIKSFKTGEKLLEEISRKSLSNNILFKTDIAVLIEEAENNVQAKTYRNLQERATLDKNDIEKIEPIERQILGIESFGIKRTENSEEEILNLVGKYNSKKINEVIDYAKNIHAEKTHLKESVFNATNIEKSNIDELD